MNEIKNFSDLTDFAYNEFAKMKESFLIEQPGTEFIETVEKEVKKYVKLYSKPLFKKQKLELKIMLAMETMPHSFVWKMFHHELWIKVKKRLGLDKPKEKKEKNKFNDEPIQVRAMVIRNQELPVPACDEE